MPFKFLPQPLSLALYCLRRRRGLYIRDLAELLKVPVSLIERYEGEDEPPFEVLLDWGLRMGYSADRIEWLAFGLTVALGEDPVLDSLVGLSSLALQKIRESAGRYCRALFTLTVGALTQITRSFNIDRAREEAAARWQELQNNPREHRKTLVEYHPRFQTWAVSERLADESEKAASDRADRALELAQLALRAAELAPGDEATRAGSLGYARALLANARRVGNRLDLAESDFALALAHWEKASPEIKKILADWRMKDLEGSLRRDQRRFPESLERLKEARAMAPAEEVPRILVKRAVTLEQMWQPEEAVKVLREAEALCGSKQDAELRLKIYFNLAANLGHIEDFAEMTRYVPIVLELAIAGRDTLILVRVCWLRARCAAGLGQTQEARAGYNQARKDFRTHTLPYDYALTCLELAVLELRAGRFSEVQALAVEMGWIFGASGIHPEACLAVALFVEATKQATATADFASRVVRYLYRAQHDPALKFAEVEPGGLLPASLAPVRLT